MAARITDEERDAIIAGTTGGKALNSAYWRSPVNRDDPDQQVKYLHDKVRFAGLNGRYADMKNAISEANAHIAKLRLLPDEFRASRLHIVNLGADLLQFHQAGQDLLRFVPKPSPAPNRRAVAARLLALTESLGEVARPATAWLHDQGLVAEIEQADLGLVLKFDALANVNREDSDFNLALSSTIGSAIRLSQKAGLRVVAIPDFAFGVLENRPPHILSFHTNGRLPGFTHFKRGDLPGYLVLDLGGYSGWSTLSGATIADLTLPPLAEAEATCRTLWQNIVAANVSKYPQDDLQEQADPLPETYVFVPMQVTGDRTQLVARFTMDEMLDLVIQRFAGTRTAVVVKPHPKEHGLGKLANLMALAEAGTIILRFDSIHRLIAGAEAVITVNSGVGSETLLHGKPIYCFGAADYDAVAHRIVSAEQFTALTSPIRPAVSPADLVRFSAYYRKTYLVEWQAPGRMDEAMQERVIEPILRLRNG